MKSIFFGILVATTSPACVTTGTPETSADSATKHNAMTIQAVGPGGARLESRRCDPIEAKERKGQAPRPQIEAGIQDDGRPYVSGGCE